MTSVSPQTDDPRKFFERRAVILPPLGLVRRLFLLAGMAGLSLATAYSVELSPLAAVTAGAVTSAFLTYAYLRTNSRFAGWAITLLFGAMVFFIPPLSAVWLIATIMTALASVVLTAGGAREDHHYFLPPLVGLLSGAIVYALVNGASVGIIAEAARSWSDEIARQMLETLKLDENRQIAESLNGGWTLETLSERLAVVTMAMVLVTWAVFLWVFGHMARFRTGRALGLTPTLLLFRVRSEYTFLLIGGLIFEILSVWFEQDRLRLLSYPLLGLCAAGFWLCYIGIVFFLWAILRGASPKDRRWWPGLLALVALAFSIYVGPFVGMADVWFDFRKIENARQPRAWD